MSYEPHEWVNDVTDITAERMNHIEQGVKAVEDEKANITFVEMALAEKADKTEIPDISGKADSSYVNAELGKKADKSEIKLVLSGANITISQDEHGNYVVNLDGDIDVEALYSAGNILADGDVTSNDGQHKLSSKQDKLNNSSSVTLKHLIIDDVAGAGINVYAGGISVDRDDVTAYDRSENAHKLTEKVNASDVLVNHAHEQGGNLNEYTTSGYYQIFGNATNGEVTNVPTSMMSVAVWVDLEVYGTPSRLTQIAHFPYSHLRKSFIRYKHDSTWSDWSEIGGGSATVEDVTNKFTIAGDNGISSVVIKSAYKVGNVVTISMEGACDDYDADNTYITLNFLDDSVKPYYPPNKIAHISASGYENDSYNTLLFFGNYYSYHDIRNSPLYLYYYGKYIYISSGFTITATYICKG